MTKLPNLICLTSENRNSRNTVPQTGVVIMIESNNGEDLDSSLVRSRQGERCLFFSSTVNHELKEDVPTGVAGDPLLGVLDSQHKTNCPNGQCIEACIDKNTNISRSIKKSESWVSSMVSEIVDDLVSLEETGEAVKEPKRTLSSSLLEISEETKVNKPYIPFNYPPLWGLTSICGRRAEMEDSAVALSGFINIPPQMLSDSPLFNSMHDKDLTGHVFGVYDGHGGSQVANYCREQMHLALAEEIGLAKENWKVESGEHNLKEKWLKIFHRCFHRLDNEVGGFPGTDGDSVVSDPDAPIAPESVGSTAAVAVVCNTHIIVANCGDSRAVLNRGKIPMPLSIDHKPNREDECARIEAAGGKVINWDGYRVSGVLAVSRSIGDRYLRPYVVADPEIMFMSRRKEDECLIIASDGLWDVITNEEACDLARKRILLWHKRNGTILSSERRMEADPAAQDAAEYLSKLAFKRGSADNISVIVVDLKAQRKFKRKT